MLPVCDTDYDQVANRLEAGADHECNPNTHATVVRAFVLINEYAESLNNKCEEVRKRQRKNNVHAEVQVQSLALLLKSLNYSHNAILHNAFCNHKYGYPYCMVRQLLHFLFLRVNFHNFETIPKQRAPDHHV